MTAGPTIITSDSRVSVTSDLIFDEATSTLTILEVQSEDSGIYGCSLDGKEEFTFEQELVVIPRVELDKEETIKVEYIPEKEVEQDVGTEIDEEYFPTTMSTTVSYEEENQFIFPTTTDSTTTETMPLNGISSSRNESGVPRTSVLTMPKSKSTMTKTSYAGLGNGSKTSSLSGGLSKTSFSFTKKK